ATEMFAFFISIVLLVDALLAKSIKEFILKFSIFFGGSLLGTLLIRGVLKEIKSAEKIKELAGDLAHANKKLESANKELRRLDEAKSEFLSIASHQLRTPLTAMKGLSSMLLEGDYGDISEKPKKAVSQIFESSERMNKLVNNLLNISRIESGRLKFNFEEVNFQELVKGVVEELKIVAEDKGLSINLKLPKNEIILKIDKQIIRQIQGQVFEKKISTLHPFNFDFYLIVFNFF
ncbi:MAG: histidine kinase dimerization/phospho-acceptor domain-containing protein, partial [bacterium]